MYTYTYIIYRYDWKQRAGETAMEQVASDLRVKPSLHPEPSLRVSTRRRRRRTSEEEEAKDDDDEEGGTAEGRKITTRRTWNTTG